MVREAPFDPSKPVDEYFIKLVDSAKIDMQQNDDDKLFLSVGLTGSGKSMLTFHFIDRYHDGNVNIDNIVIGREKFATTLKRIKNEVVKGVTGLSLWFDEADSDNMEQNAKWNKRLFALYMKIRYLKILHMWCWPSLKSVDRRFVEERVNGVFFCYTKEKFNPRSYAYFPKSSILRMMDDDVRLNVHNLKKSINKYAMWIGKFKDYNGAAKEQYLAMKSEKGSDAVDEFADEFGKDKTVTATQQMDADGIAQRHVAFKSVNLTRGTAYSREVELRRLGVITTEEGKLTKNDIESIKNFAEVKSNVIKSYVKTPPMG